MILINNKEIPENNRFRTRFISKVKNISNILLTEVDISYLRDPVNNNSKQYFTKINCYKIPKGEYIYNLLIKKFPKDLSEKIINILFRIEESENINTYISSYNSLTPNQNSNKYEIKFQLKDITDNLHVSNYQYKILYDIINLKLNINLRNLLNSKSSFDIIEIFKLSDNIFDFFNFLTL